MDIKVNQKSYNMGNSWSDITDADIEFNGKMILLRSAVKDVGNALYKRFISLLEATCTIKLIKSSTGKLESVFIFEPYVPMILSEILRDFGQVVLNNTGKPVISKSKNKEIAKILVDMFKIK